MTPPPFTPTHLPYSHSLLFGGPGVEVKMITGDHTTIAKETARRLGMGDAIFNTAALRGDDGEGEADPEVMRIIRSADGFAEVMQVMRVAASPP